MAIDYSTMEYIFFWASAVLCLLVFTIAAIIKGIRLPVWLIGIATIGYSMAFDIFFGDVLGFHHYISPAESTLYITLAAVLIYPALNMVYVIFLPEDPRKIIGYTLLWTLAMLLFEYVSVIARVVVFTGWKPIPWSILTYAVTYGWVVLLYTKLAGTRRLRFSRYH